MFSSWLEWLPYEREHENFAGDSRTDSAGNLCLARRREVAGRADSRRDLGVVRSDSANQAEPSLTGVRE